MYDVLKFLISHSACSESVGGPSGVVRGTAAAIPVCWRWRLEVSPPTVRQRPIRSLGDVAAATKCRTMSHLTLCSAQLGTSCRFPHPSNYFQWINSTSGLATAPQTESWSTPAHKVQPFRQSAIVFAHFPGISHCQSPKWRLKLFLVPVLTCNFDFSHPVSY